MLKTKKPKKKKTRQEPYPSSSSRTPSLTPSPPSRVPIEEEPLPSSAEVSIDMYTPVHLSTPAKLNLTSNTPHSSQPGAYSKLDNNLKNVVDAQLARMVQDLKCSPEDPHIVNPVTTFIHPEPYQEPVPSIMTDPTDQSFALNLPADAHADLFEQSSHHPFDIIVTQLDTVFDSASYPVNFG